MELLTVNLFGYLLFICSYYVCKTEPIHVNEGTLKPFFKTAVSEFSQHEVVKPMIYTDGKPLKPSQYKDNHPEELTVVIGTRQGQLTLVLARNKNLFTKRYIEKSVTSANRYNLRRPHFKKLQNHCYYHGHVQGVPHSIVAISTCHGISGYIQYGKTVLHIEPGYDLDQESHRLYNDVHSINKPSNCGAQHNVHAKKPNETLEMEHKYDVFKRMKRSAPHPYDGNKNTRYVEMYIVNDLRTFESNRRDLDAQLRKTKNIINIVSRLYQPFNIYIALVGIENWTQQDMFTITTKADSTLENFLHYRRSVINPKHSNDNAQLITDTTFANGVVGKAIKGTICTYKYSGGVNLNLATPGQTATTIAHELGHNFGMDHDNYTICQCKEDKCIMAATSGGSKDASINTPTQWSSCSMLALQEAFEMGMDYCLRNIPEQLYDGPVCGNGFTEEGEECDCGMPGACVSKCCNASTCKLTSGAVCATGGCCDLNTCKLKEAATMCRPSNGECDLPEFCWGNDPMCPKDVYLQDGTDCHNGQSYCLNGTCKTHTGQCKLLWGSTGRVSDPVCFKHLNTNGSKHGNCGYNWTNPRYEPCQRDDVMCGLLHCVHQNEKLMFWKDNLAHATPATFLTVGPTTYVCRGAILDVGLDMPDPGMVPDGAKCGDRKMCYQHKCMDISHMRVKSCPHDCSDRGVCNSNGNCHCEEGWGGDDCDSAGNGGSKDSGPITTSNYNGLIVALVVVFLILLIFVVLGVLTYYFKDNLLAWWNNKLQKKHDEQSQPLRPVHPPPKRSSPTKPASGPDVPPPPYDLIANSQPIVKNKSASRPAVPKPASKPSANNRNHGFSVKISGPVLTGSTHKDTKSQVQTSPVPNHKPLPPQKPSQPPKYPVDSKPVNKQPAKHQIESKPVSNQSDKNASTVKSKVDTEVDSNNDGKSRFGDLFKMPSFSKSDKKGPKVETTKQDDVPAVDIVKKRELTRNISSPVLISTTDRRSKHLVKLESLNVNSSPAEERNSSPPPPVPPHVSLNKNQYENVRSNRPLPPRPVSMPESECGDEIAVEKQNARKSAVMSSSPRMPERPPPPPVKPNVDNTRKMLEDELAKLDNINVEIPRDSPERQTSVPLLPSKPKEIKPKPRATVSKSADGNKKPMIPKTAAGKTKSDTSKKKPIPTKSGETHRPTFNLKGRSGVTNDRKSGKSISSKQTNRSEGLLPTEPSRKPSTESIDDDEDSGEASVAGLAKRFEAQKKPLLADRSVKRTQSATKAPMTPPKPRTGVKQIRSVDV